MKKKNLIITSLIIVILIIIISVIALNSSFELKLNGDSVIEIDVNTNYEDSGYILYHFGKEANDQVLISNNVDITKVGEYQVGYTFKRLFFNKTVVRTVIVKDTEAPTISLNGNSVINIKVGDNYTDQGATAIDNYDGEITNNIVIEGEVNTKQAGTYELVYKIVDSSGNESSISRTVIVKNVATSSSSNNSQKPSTSTNNSSSNNSSDSKYTGGYGEIIEGPTYINGILIVNKKYKLPSNFGGTNETANNALKELQAGAKAAGFSAKLVSGFRSYQTQERIYNNYIKQWGQEYTDTVSARPGHSEHQTGLAFDVGELKKSYGETAEGIWLRENCHKYGFIIRYQKGKEDITGYAYEPWHIRYVGVEAATYIMANNLTLEEYLGV